MLLIMSSVIWARTWQTHADRYVSINLSASDFHTSRLIARINQKTEQYAVRPQQIKFEVTEHAFLDVEKMTPIILAFPPGWLRSGN
ncbi:putative EAL domain protein regulator [Escherichia coli]|nr:putative EAL domain protein regulator [Escherichia coli]